MRIFFIALLIAMLPLRGWVGNAMATGMVANSIQVQGSVAVSSHCVEQKNKDQNKERSGACTACQVCHIVGLAAPVSMMATLAIPFSLPQFAAVQFASAELAFSQKPPIS